MSNLRAPPARLGVGERDKVGEATPRVPTISGRHGVRCLAQGTWSPRGGVRSGTRRRLDDRPVLAAIEPAAGRREHHAYPGRGPELSAAAMEPTGEQREHPTMTLTQFFVWGLLQWSPPVNSGSTRAPERHPDEQERAAMEPAGERREHGCRGRRSRRSSPSRNGARLSSAGAPAVSWSGTSCFTCRNGARRRSAGIPA